MKRKRAGGLYRIRSAGARLRGIATRLLNVPLLIHPQKGDAILAVLGPHLGLSPQSIPVAAMDMYDDLDEEDDDLDQEDMEQQDEPGVSVVSIHGPLVKRSSGLDAMSGGPTGYSRIESELRECLANDNCTAIVLDVDSPGGEAAGMFDLASFIAANRGAKPIVSIANDDAYSAAYCLAAAADEMLVTQIGGAGSIGCYMLHCNMSGWDKKTGLDFTYVFSGAKKINGNPHAPLDGEALAEAQAECDRIRGMFVESVARNRSVDAQALLDTEAGCYMGAASIPLLADGVGTLGDAIELAQSMVKKPVSVPVVQPAAASSAKSIRLRFPSKAASGISASDTDWVAGALLPTSRSWADHQFIEGAPILAVRKFGTLTLAAGADGASKVSGLLAPYNSTSCDLGGFREVFAPGCFDLSLKSDDDLRSMLNHDVNCVLGRKSAGTARFWTEADGLHYEADLPDTQYARDLQVSMRRGDIRESSAAFYILQYRWELRSGTRTRIIEEAKLVEGGPHSFAAYGASTAAPVENQEDSAAANELELIGARLQLLKIA